MERGRYLRHHEPKRPLLVSGRQPPGFIPVRAQEPHDRDEIYMVASGQGTFVRGEERVAFRANDMLFVPARMQHRFEDFSADFATWVVFWGPQGGERDNPFP